MKSLFNMQSRIVVRLRLLPQIITGLCFFLMAFPAMGQDEEAEAVPVERPVAATFESSLLIDNQTVMVPIKNTFEFDIQHRFGTMQNGFTDLAGMYAPSNIRMGFFFVPVNNLAVGFGFSKKNTLLDFNAKYALLKQYKGWRMPVSVTYFGNVVLDPRNEEDTEIYHKTDRLSFFHQLIIARKFNSWLSVQVAPSLSHYNLQTDRAMDNDHFAIAFGAQVKISPVMSILVNVDQPISRHDQRNPNPNVCVGVQMSTSSHAFQIFLGNYDGLIPQENNMYFQGNNYDDFGGFWDHMANRFRIGFNITRLWNF